MRGSFNIRAKRYNFFLLIVSFSAAFLLGEIFLRVTGIGSFPRYIMINNKLCIRRPYAHYINRKEKVNLVKINNLGFHDYDIQIRNDKYRILCLGDSFTEGAQVDLDNLFTSLLEKKFSKKAVQLK